MSRTRWVAALAAAATTACLIVTPTHVLGATPPPNPSDGQLQSAAQQKAAVADEVGRLSAQVAAVQTQLMQLQASQELAEQKLAYALSRLVQAKDAAAAALATVRKAQNLVNNAQGRFRSFVQATYMSGDVGGTAGSLLTAADPNVLLQRSALQDYESSHQLDAIGNLQAATVAKSNADAAARTAVKRQARATGFAKQAKIEADAAVLAAKSQEALLQSSLANSQTRLAQAQIHLATLNNQRAVFIAYQKRQAEIRAAQERARLLALQLAREQAARLVAQELARERARGSGGGSGNPGGSGGGGGGGAAPSPSGGSWTAARGSDAVSRAERYLGWMYSWAGGNASGPTYGVCAGDGAFNDCHVLGFDCSGLTLYAWAPYLSMAHYASSQYWQAGSFHPSTSTLMPGDLVFWSADGTVAGIHHVAMYIGGGNVIQAPASGEVIQITPLGSVDWGYFGATRPLS